MMIALAPPNCASPALLFGNESCKIHAAKEGGKVGLAGCVSASFWNHRKKGGFV